MLPILLREHRDEVSERIRRALAPRSTLAATIIGYQLGFVDRDGNARESESLLVHPSLCLWAVAACDGDAHSAVPLAAGIEMLREFIRIHRDIQDARREDAGRETVWSLWGVGQGVNAGDALNALAISLLTCGSLDEGRMLRIFERVVAAVNESVHGESSDLEGVRDPLSRRGLEVAFRVSGSLMGTSLEAGALAAGAPQSTVRAFRRAGRLLGVAAHTPAIAERCAERACALVAGSGIRAIWLERFQEMAGYLAQRTR